VGFPAVCSGHLVSALTAVAIVAAASAAAPGQAVVSASLPGQAGSGPGPGRHVKATLVAETDAVAPGRTLVAGIRLQMDAGWHTYWRNPGDSGLPTRVRWTLPDGFVAGDLQWPAPERFAAGPIVSYGYSGEVLLPVAVRVPATLAGPQAHLTARVDWLECQEACLPGRAELTLALPVRAAPQPGAAAPSFVAARRSVPAPAPAWSITASADPPGLVLAWRAPAGEEAKDAYFYPLAPRVLEHAQPQALERGAARRYRLRLARDSNGEPVERLAGVLVVDTAKGRRALSVDVPVTTPARTTRN
jgi:DsbC/DsbD-like thiol-disulfide interchange protein